MNKKILIFFLLVAIPVIAKAWNASSRIETQTETQIIRSIIQFTKGSQSVTYKPDSPPYGSVSLEKVIFKGLPPLFVTGWANGAHTMIFKVFNPEKNGDTPICEHNSFSESAKLRLVKKNLQIQIYENNSTDSSWIPCNDISRKTQSTSKKKKK